jgi:putative transposase
MPRTARASRAEVCYHVLSRGNARRTIFHDDNDFNTFSSLLNRAGSERPMRLLAWCLMPNHVHLVLRPFGDGDLGLWMHWLLTCHVRYHQRRHSTVGRIWQGRFKAFPIQADSHLLTVLRYVERNPVRALIVRRSVDWAWSSAAHRDPESGEPSSSEGLLNRAPVDLPQPWADWVDRPLTDAELDGVRRSAQRERPYGDPAWVHGAVDRLGLHSTLNPRGRPSCKM